MNYWDGEGTPKIGQMFGTKYNDFIFDNDGRYDFTNITVEADAYFVGLDSNGWKVVELDFHIEPNLEKMQIINKLAEEERCFPSYDGFRGDFPEAYPIKSSRQIDQNHN